jgi:hypothetical protein
LRRLLEAAIVAGLADPAQPARVDDPDLSSYIGRYYPTTARFNVAAWRNGHATPAEVTQSDTGLTFRRGSRYLFGELGNYVNTSRCPGFIPHCHGQ